MKVKKLLLLFALFSSFSLSVLAQEQKVTGRVSGATGPLEGTTVSVKGSTVATTTDKDGNYSITVPNGGTLVFTYAGMQSEQKKVNSAGPINVTMVAAPNALEEVVVVGYGTQKKSVLTGAISSVKAR